MRVSRLSAAVDLGRVVNLDDLTEKLVVIHQFTDDMVDHTELKQREGLDIVDSELSAISRAMATLARTHRDTPMIGRSHGIHAEPTTFGVKLAGFYAEFARILGIDRRSLYRRLEGPAPAPSTK